MTTLYRVDYVPECYDEPYDPYKSAPIWVFESINDILTYAESDEDIRGSYPDGSIGITWDPKTRRGWFSNFSTIFEGDPAVLDHDYLITEVHLFDKETDL